MMPRNERPKSKGPFTALQRKLGALFANRGFLRVFSVLMAVIVWCVMVASEGKLTRRKQFSDVALTVSGESALLSKGYIVTDDLTSVLPSVSMTVEVTQSNYDRAVASSYNPHLELSSISSDGEVQVPVTYSSQAYGKVSSCTPDSVTLHVERYITRRVPVVVTLTGTLASGLYLYDYEADPYTLVVSGPQSLVSGVTRASVLLDQSVLSAEKMSDRMALPFELQDTNGLPVVSGKISVTNQSVIVRGVTVEPRMAPMKQVPIDTNALLTGEPAEGYEVVETWAAEETVALAADQEVLDSITIVPIDTPMDITGLRATTSGLVRLKTISSLKNKIPSQMAVTVVIQEKQIERTFRNVAIQAEGASEDQQVSLSHKKTTVQLKGGYQFINALSADDIMLYVDVSKLSAGTQKLPVQVRIDNAQNFTCALDVTEVGVTVREK